MIIYIIYSDDSLEKILNSLTQKPIKLLQNLISNDEAL